MHKETRASSTKLPGGMQSRDPSRKKGEGPTESTLVKTALEDLQDRIEKIENVRSEEVVLGVGYTGVRTSTGDVGLANTPLGELVPESCNIFSRAGSLTEVPTIELARLADSWDLSERVVGVAALNALSQTAIKKGRDDFVKRYGDAVDLIEVGKDDVVALVGNMRPSAEKLRLRAKEVLVLERSLGLRDKYTLPDTAVEAVIPRADVVFMTGATLCSGTADRILTLSRNAREVVMMGASAGIFPGAIFKKGATAIGSMEIVDARGAMMAAAQGGGTSALMRLAKFVLYQSGATETRPTKKT